MNNKNNIVYLKNELLKSYAVEKTVMEFYRDVFPVGSFEREGYLEDEKANGILCSIQNGKGKHSLVFDDLEEIKNHLEDEFVIISPVAYFGKRRTARNASLLFGMCFDLDAVGIKELTWILDRLENSYFPRATYIANSGNGIHLYYLFKEPVALYRCNHEKLSNLKHKLTDLIWNKYTSQISIENRQYQGIFQGFRMVGTQNKIGNDKIKVFKTGKKIDIEYLNEFVPDEYKIKNLRYESSLTLEEAKNKYPEWYKKRIEEGQSKGRWIVKRDLYDWWLNKIKTDTDLKVGHRYWCIAVLSSYAIKCGIEEDELRKDAYSLIDLMNKLQDDFTKDDVESALNLYSENYVYFPRKEIARTSGLNIPINKRNYQKQKNHLEEARAIRDIRQNRIKKVWYENSPHSGRKSKKDVVQKWKKENPKGKKIDCSRETGLHINTIYKNW